jgi:type II secretory pathway pseudopilin PulG
MATTRFAGRRRAAARAFTLIEALMASAILMGIVTAVTAAIIAGQQNALEAQERIAGTLAAEALLGALLAEDYDTLATWHNYREEPGEMVDAEGQPLPPVFGTVGRQVTVTSTFQTIDPPGINIAGRTVRVRAFDVDGRVLADLTRYVAEPQS